MHPSREFAGRVLTSVQAFKICKDKDFVPEMVFLLGKMGDNKKALMLIIERLGDVNRAIDFAKERNDKDLWEDLLKYSETRPGASRLPQALCDTC